MTGPPATERTIGPFTLEYDAKLHELYVAVGEEVKAMAECVGEEDWQAFLLASGGSGERLMTEAECDRRIASHLGAMEADLAGGSGEAPAGLTEREQLFTEALDAAEAIITWHDAQRIEPGLVTDDDLSAVTERYIAAVAALRGPVGGEAGQDGGTV